MSTTSNIAWRYIRSSSSSKAVLAMTIISILGIAIGVATLTVTLSVAGGFGDAYRKSITDFSAHVVLLSTGEIEDYQKKLGELKKFEVSEAEKEEWKKSELTVSLLRFIKSLWVKFDFHYMNITFDHPDAWYSALLDWVHPANVSSYMYVHNLYPKGLISRISKLLELSQRGIVAVNPFIYREGLVVFNGQIRGIIIKGVEPTGFKKVNNVDAQVPEGENISLGLQLANELGVKKGDSIRIMLPEHWEDGRAGRFKELVVTDTFETGMYDFDSQFALLNLDAAQKIFNAPNKVSGIEIKLDDWEKSRAVSNRMEREFIYPFYVTNWQELNRSLFEAVKLEKIMFIIIMGALVIVAAFNIIGTVMLRILYKTSDISIFRALGMDVHRIKKVFISQGLIVGAFGTAIGIIIALILIWSIQEFGWIEIPSEIYLLKTLPVCISKTACVMIAAFSLIVCWLTSVMAARKVTQLPLIKGLHRL